MLFTVYNTSMEVICSYERISTVAVVTANKIEAWFTREI